MNPNTSEVESSPFDYRQVEVERFTRCLRAGDSCSIVGVSGMAKSNLFRYLLNTAVRREYLGNEWWNYLFLAVDTHAMGEVSDRAMYDLLLGLMVKETQGSALPEGLITHIQKLHQQSLNTSDLLLWQRAFTQAVEAVLNFDKNFKLVFLFDQFEEVYAKFSPRFFTFLRSLRDSYKYRLCYALFTRDEVQRLDTSSEFEEFYELFSANVIGLGPYSHKDALSLLTRVSERYGQPVSVEMCEQLIDLTGGHPGLLKASCMAVLNSELTLPVDEQATCQTLLQVDDIRNECTKLWISLSQEEQETLHSLAVSGATAFCSPDMARRLRLKHLVKDQHGELQLFCHLFATFVAEQKLGKPHETKVQAGPIRIDTAGEVWVRGNLLAPSLSKKELLLLQYLCLEPGRLRNKDEIIAVVYPDEYQVGGTVTDDAITALIKRLRERLQQFSAGANYITTVRGKGYRLELG